jgi:hypothetical protein
MTNYYFTSLEANALFEATSIAISIIITCTMTLIAMLIKDYNISIIVSMNLPSAIINMFKFKVKTGRIFMFMIIIICSIISKAIVTIINSIIRPQSVLVGSKAMNIELSSGGYGINNMTMTCPNVYNCVYNEADINAISAASGIPSSQFTWNNEWPTYGTPIYADRGSYTSMIYKDSDLMLKLGSMGSSTGEYGGHILFDVFINSTNIDNNTFATWGLLTQEPNPQMFMSATSDILIAQISEGAISGSDLYYSPCGLWFRGPALAIKNLGIRSTEYCSEMYITSNGSTYWAQYTFDTLVNTITTFNESTLEKTILQSKHFPNITNVWKDIYARSNFSHCGPCALSVSSVNSTDTETAIQYNIQMSLTQSYSVSMLVRANLTRINDHRLTNISSNYTVSLWPNSSESLPILTVPMTRNGTIGTIIRYLSGLGTTEFTNNNYAPLNEYPELIYPEIIANLSLGITATTEAIVSIIAPRYIISGVQLAIFLAIIFMSIILLIISKFGLWSIYGYHLSETIASTIIPDRKKYDYQLNVLNKHECNYILINDHKISCESNNDASLTDLISDHQK